MLLQFDIKNELAIGYVEQATPASHDPSCYGGCGRTELTDCRERRPSSSCVLENLGIWGLDEWILCGREEPAMRLPID